MTATTARLARIARAGRHDGRSCPVCHGKARVMVTWEGKPATLDPGPCPGCGALPVRVAVVYGDPDGAG